MIQRVADLVRFNLPQAVADLGHPSCTDWGFTLDHANESFDWRASKPRSLIPIFESSGS